ncbi:MAG: hypothetical protein KAG28_00975 [Cocleimonas sp.]|nr:hypothetical protein [Cocleimonas sp.]
MANQSDDEKKRIVYKDKIIIKEVKKPSEDILALKKELGSVQRKLGWEKAKDHKHKTALKLYQKSLEYDANNWMVLLWGTC